MVNELLTYYRRQLDLIAYPRAILNFCPPSALIIPRSYRKTDSFLLFHAKTVDIESNEATFCSADGSWLLAFTKTGKLARFLPAAFKTQV